jgi:hypothetical protein
MDFQAALHQQAALAQQAQNAVDSNEAENIRSQSIADAEREEEPNAN